MIDKTAEPTPPNRWQSVLAVTLRLVLGVMFVYSGVLKLREPQSFADSVASFRLLPEFLIVPLALGLPVFECLLGAWLCVGRWRRPAAFCSLVTSGIFLVALGSAFARGLPVDCGCFGSGGDPILGSGHTLAAILRDLALLGASAFLYRDARPFQKAAHPHR